MNILVTGGAGYIGSHTVVALTGQGHRAVVVDNLSNASAESLRRVERITGQSIPFHQADVRDADAMEEILAAEQFDCCIHFAGLKAVGESVAKPLEYYDNNIGGTLCLLKALRSHGCKNLIFSSSATVYGDPAEIPITENCPKGQCTNPYGWTKSMQEQMFADLVTADTRSGAEDHWNVVLLRYFNPI
ncbi:MAG: SDR family NAD(P)-dependent oxidoreductase, partial [Oscillospiraceae bacterium]|nr:SDR family NAD(P)-dependent oxidoreductase [Oscillospiraceae bacterium]